jgi:hypothetical protein
LTESRNVPEEKDADAWKSVVLNLSTFPCEFKLKLLPYLALIVIGTDAITKNISASIVIFFIKCTIAPPWINRY